MSKISAGLNIVAVSGLVVSTIQFLAGNYNGANYGIDTAIFFAVMASNLKGKE